MLQKWHAVSQSFAVPRDRGRSTILLDSQAVREDPVLSNQLFRSRWA